MITSEQIDNSQLKEGKIFPNQCKHKYKLNLMVSKSTHEPSDPEVQNNYLCDRLNGVRIISNFGGFDLKSNNGQHGLFIKQATPSHARFMCEILSEFHVY